MLNPPVYAPLPPIDADLLTIFIAQRIVRHESPAFSWRNCRGIGVLTTARADEPKTFSPKGRIGLVFGDSGGRPEPRGPSRDRGLSSKIRDRSKAGRPFRAGAEVARQKHPGGSRPPRSHERHYDRLRPGNVCRFVEKIETAEDFEKLMNAVNVPWAQSGQWLSPDELRYVLNALGKVSSRVPRSHLGKGFRRRPNYQGALRRGKLWLADFAVKARGGWIYEYRDAIDEKNRMTGSSRTLVIGTASISSPSARTAVHAILSCMTAASPSGPETRAR